MEFFQIILFTAVDGSAITVGQMAFALLVLVLGLLLCQFLSGIIKRRLTNTSLDANAAIVIARAVFYITFVGVVLTVLALLRIPLTALAFLSGAVAIGVGFGAQAVINNIISGWILMTSRPVRIGDFVEVEGSLGTVEDIGNRSTQIRRIDGVHLMVPNSIMLERIVVNWTLVDRNIRSNVSVGVAYGSSARSVEALLMEAVTDHPSVLKDPPPVIFFDEFGDSALTFEAVFWSDVSGDKQLRTVRSDLRYRIDELFRESGIVIAFPQRDLHINANQPLQVAVLASDVGKK